MLNYYIGKHVMRWGIGLVILMAAPMFQGCKGCSDNSKKGDDCPPGTKNCPCMENDVCNDGLTCDQNVCIGEDIIPLSVSDASARSCEVLMTEQADTRVTGLVVTEDAKASFVRHEPKVAVSFMAVTDEPIADGNVSVRAVGYVIDGLTIEKTNCFDNEGTAIAGVDVTLNE